MITVVLNLVIARGEEGFFYGRETVPTDDPESPLIDEAIKRLRGPHAPWVRIHLYDPATGKALS